MTLWKPQQIALKPNKNGLFFWVETECTEYMGPVEVEEVKKTGPKRKGKKDSEARQSDFVNGLEIHQSTGSVKLWNQSKH